VHRQIIASAEALQGQKNVLRRRLIKGLLRSDAQTGLRTGMTVPSISLYDAAYL
jgi:stress-induced morphogen